MLGLQTPERAAECLPQFIEPMLPTLVTEGPEGESWLHEIKYDGFRTQLVLDWARARAFTRRGFDWSERYSPILAAAQNLNCSSANHRR